MTALSKYQTVGRTFHGLSLFLVACVGMGAVFFTIASALGYAPWLNLPLTFGDSTYEHAGTYLQIAAAMVLGAWMFFLPTNARIVALEQQHSPQNITMEDVARAYHIAHAADRSGVFELQSEYDQVRERMTFLRDHPELRQLNKGLIEISAQMSQQSHHLANIYSDKKVANAKATLRRREEEADRQQTKITEVLHHCQEVRAWSRQVETKEKAVASQLAELDQKLRATLPLLGYEMEQEELMEDNVVALPKKPAME